MKWKCVFPKRFIVRNALIAVIKAAIHSIFWETKWVLVCIGSKIFFHVNQPLELIQASHYLMCCFSDIYYTLKWTYKAAGICVNMDVNLIFKWLHLLSLLIIQFHHVGQFSSVTQSCPTLGDPMDCSMPGLPIHYQLLEFTHIHVHWVSDAIPPSHSLSSPSPPAFNLSQHQGLSQWVSSSHQVAKVLLLTASASVLPVNIRTDFL